MKISVLYNVLIISLFLPISLQAQGTEEAGAIYQRRVGIFALLYNGKLENGYAHGYVNTPYHPDEYVEGELEYKGMNYRNIHLRLDCDTQHLIVQSPDQRFNISLEPEDIKRATLGGRTFVYFDRKTDGAPESAYYAALYEGKGWGIYKQYYVNNVGREYVGRHMLSKFFLKERLFFVKDGKWSRLSGRNDFIRHFKQHRQALQRFCKEQHLQLGKEHEDDWNCLGRYCTTLME